VSWVRLHDGALSHPKLVGLIDWKNPFCLWIWGLSYCQTHLTDGLIPLAALPNFVAVRTASRLVSGGLWHKADGGGFSVHDYLNWNDSKELVTRKRAEAKARISHSRDRRSQEVRANASRECSLENERVGSTLGRVLTTISNKSDDESLDNRAAAFIDRYPLIYAKARSGAGYRVKEARDFPAFLDLVSREPDDARLDSLLELFLMLKGRDVLNVPGSPGQFVYMYPECDRLLRENGR
jgi:hypothetical protein